MALAPLLDREDELRRLEEAWIGASRGDSRFVAVVGRRRVGKTFLLSHFVQGKRAVFFGATQQAEGVELRRLHEAVLRDLGPRVADLAGGGFANWEAALRFFFALAAGEPLLVVLDEVPYLARSTKGFASILQHAWDHRPAGSRLALVITGSAVSAMTALFGPRGPLRGRPSLVLGVRPLPAHQARVFLPRLGSATFFEAYAACGGYPLHLLRWDQSLSTHENLLVLAGTAGGILLDDADSMLREELASPSTHARVLAAVARGRGAYVEIAREVGKRVQYSLELLERAGFVRRSVPVGAPAGARPAYEIDDPYLRFWFRVLSSDSSLIEAGQGRAVLRRRAPEWQKHLGWVFEETARVHARRLVDQGKLPADLLIGRWWLHRGRQTYEIDVLGVRGARTALLGSARWQESPLGTAALRQLHSLLSVAPDPLDQVRFAFWSRGGVDRDLRRADVLAYTPREMLA